MKKHLGKGLEALISDLNITNELTKKENILYIDISQIELPKWQPRRKFDEEKLNQLASSVKQTGIIEPIVVAPKEANKYEIICGERRFRAAQIAGLKEIPVIIKTLDEKERRILSLVENIQREDLNPVEEAYAYKNLIEDFGFTQEELSQLLSKDRSVIANTIRILSLPKEVIGYIEDGLISAGHARSLASIKEQKIILELAEKIIQDKLTVRDVENIVKHLKAKKQIPKKQKSIQPEILELQNELSQILGSKVKINPVSNKKGKIIIFYSSLEEFDNILKKLRNI